MEFNGMFIFLALALAQVTFISAQEDTCPNLETVEDLSDPFVAQKVKRDLTHAIWDSPLLSQPTELVAHLRDIILEMSDSDSFYFTEVAFQFTGWSTCFLAESNNYYPNFCPFASVINKTVEWQATGDAEIFMKSLNETVDAVPYALSSLSHAALVELECKNISERLMVSQNCWQNGLVSYQDEVWEIFGRLMPWPLLKIHNLLTSSPLFSDRAYATMLTFILTPAQYNYFTHQRYSLLIETGRYFTNAANNSKCCCEEWNTRMDTLNALHYETAQENAGAQANELANECEL